MKHLMEHNEVEEIEHACMALEWLRRNVPAWDEQLRTYLFTSASITELEEAATGGEGSGESPSETAGDIGIGSLKT
jgi:hypothetical protein